MTTNTLLATKLQAPPTRPKERVIQRPHLWTRLENVLSYPLTLISAPAGYGKTTLVSDFIQQQRPHKFGWLSLDHDDDAGAAGDASEFLHYLIAALQSAFPDIGQAALALLQLPQPVPAKSVLIALVNE